MKVAVTGATGHLGGLIVRELHARGHEVIILVRGADFPSLQDIPVQIIRGDLDQPKALQALVEDCDAVVHSAGLISISGDMKGLVQRVNVAGTRHVMDAAQKAGVPRVIHVSSVHAYDQQPVDQPLDETRAYAPDHTFAYDRSKRDGQKLALSYASSDMHVMSINPTSIMGPYDFRPSKLGRAVMEMYTGRFPFVFPGGYDFCDGRDIAKAVGNGLTQGCNGEAYLTGANWHSLKELFQIVSEVSGKKKKPVVIPVAGAYAGLPFIHAISSISGKEPLYTREAIVAVTEGNHCILSDKARHDLDYTTRPLRETVQDTCQWFLENGYLE